MATVQKKKKAMFLCLCTGRETHCVTKYKMKSNSNQKKSRTRDLSAPTPLAESSREEVFLSLQRCGLHAYFMN